MRTEKRIAYLWANESVGWLIFAIVMALLVTGCRTPKTITIEKPVYIHDTLNTVKELHDSIYIDNWHTIYQKGDTVYITKNQITVKYRTITDTAYKYVEKPVPVTVSKIKWVEKQLRWWQMSLMFVGIISIIGVLGCIVWKTRSWWIKIIRLWIPKR